MTVVEPSAGAPARPGGGRVGRRPKGGAPEPYDFRRPAKLSREHVRTLQIAYETFARQWTTLLTSTLRAVAQTSLVSIEQLTYDEYVGTLANPTVLGILALEPLPGSGILEVSMSNAMTSIDYLLGGAGQGTQPQRPLSDIESALLRGLFSRVLGELRYAFESLVRFDPQLIQIEYNPQFAQAAAPSDMVIVASFDLRVGADECLATVCLPFAGLFPHLEAASGHGLSSERERAAREAAARQVSRNLEAVPIDVAVRFRPARVTPEQVLTLQIGDVLPLPHPVSAPLAVTAADVTFAYAVPGSHGKHLACLVVEPPEGDPAS